jgi:hypothetical protein
MFSPKKTQATIDFENANSDLRKLIESARYVADRDKTSRAITEFHTLINLYNERGKKAGAQQAWLLVEGI